MVAPHAGAWIETHYWYRGEDGPALPPTRGHGLKLRTSRVSRAPGPVAPHAGAWIETRVHCLYPGNAPLPPTRGHGLKPRKR